MSLLAFKLDTPELILILVAGIVLFGRRLPGLGRRLGMAVVAVGNSAGRAPWYFGAALVLLALWLLGLLLVVLAK